MSNSNIIDYETLKSVFGVKTPAQLSAMLSKNNVNFLCGSHGRPMTTIDSLNQALDLKNSSTKSKIKITHNPDIPIIEI